VEEILSERLSTVFNTKQSWWQQTEMIRKWK